MIFTQIKIDRISCRVNPRSFLDWIKKKRPMEGENVEIVLGGRTTGVAGTSCSSPIFGGLVALLNEQRLAAGKGPLGYLKPLLYKNAQAFTDVTEGSNPGCGTKGFPAAKGWDPVTGLGTPKFDALSKLVAGLP